VKRGSLARVEPEGTVKRMWEAIETYMDPGCVKTVAGD